MARAVVKRSVSQAVKAAPPRHSRPKSPLPVLCLRSFPNRPKGRPRVLNGCTRSSLTDFARRHALTMVACNF